MAKDGEVRIPPRGPLPILPSLWGPWSKLGWKVGRWGGSQGSTTGHCFPFPGRPSKAGLVRPVTRAKSPLQEAFRGPPPWDPGHTLIAKLTVAGMMKPQEKQF